MVLYKVSQRRFFSLNWMKRLWLFYITRPPIQQCTGSFCWWKGPLFREVMLEDKLRHRNLPASQPAQWHVERASGKYGLQISNPSAKLRYKTKPTSALSKFQNNILVLSWHFQSQKNQSMCRKTINQTQQYVPYEVLVILIIVRMKYVNAQHT